MLRPNLRSLFSCRPTNLHHIFSLSSSTVSFLPSQHLHYLSTTTSRSLSLDNENYAKRFMEDFFSSIWNKGLMYDIRYVAAGIEDINVEKWQQECTKMGILFKDCAEYTRRKSKTPEKMEEMI
jgi:hypothetical protein